MSKSAIVALCAGVALVLAGCGGGGGDTSESDGPLRVYYASSLDPGDTADLIGLQENSAKVGTLQDDSAVVSGLLRGSADVGNVDMQAALEAVSQDIPLKILYVSEVTPEYVVVSRPEFKSASDLSGKRVGYHAKGSQTEVFVKQFMKAEAPSIYSSVKFVALENSPRRAQALVGDKLDASSLETIDYVNLEQQGEFNLLGSWKDLPGHARDAIANVWITTEDKYKQNTERFKELAEALQSGYNEFYSNDEKWLEVAKSELPDIDASLLPDVYETYKDMGLYTKPGVQPITPELFETTEKFYRKYGGDWDEPISDDIVAYDVVKAGAAVEGNK